MQKNDHPRPLKVLITRPEQKAQVLALSLSQQGIASHSQPLFDYQAITQPTAIPEALLRADIIIFVSVAAVEFAQLHWPLFSWQHKQIFAVGTATEKALKAISVNHAITPKQQNSEGLLALAALCDSIKSKSVTIIRGNNGREHLASTLRKRGATVNYLAVYKKVWRVLPTNIGKQWYQQQINCIVVTSNAILEKLVQVFTEPTINEGSQQLTRYWLKECQWVTVSARITDHAKQLGIKHIITSTGASDEKLTNCLQVVQNQ